MTSLSCGGWAATSSTDVVVAARSLSSVPGSRYSVAASSSSSPKHGTSRTSSANCSSAASRASTAPSALRSARTSSRARQPVSSTTPPARTWGTSTSSAPSCLIVASRFFIPLASRTLRSRAAVRQPEQKTSRKTGTKATSSTSCPAWPHTAPMSLPLVGRQLPPPSSSPSSSARSQCVRTSFRLSFSHSLKARRPVPRTSSITTRVNDQPMIRRMSRHR